MASSSSKPQRTFTGQHMLIAMLLFFGVIVSVNMTMAVMAGRTWTGLVVKNSYVESQKYNDRLSQAKAQRAQGWRSSLIYRDDRLIFEMQDRTGDPVTLENAQLFYGRPAFEQADQIIPLTATSPGQYFANITLKPGEWILRISGTISGHPYRRDSRIRVSSRSRITHEH